MKGLFRLALLAMCSLFGSFLSFGQNVPAQVDSQQTRVVMTKLSPLGYPPLARQARIAGDVKVALRIRPDGSVESVELFSGHPMLAPAAIWSAKQSRFECHMCDGVTSYTLTYTFVTGVEPRQEPDCSGEQHPPVVQQLSDHIVVTADPLIICDPSSQITRIKWRSAKCLYLWHCSSKVIESQ